MITSAEITTPGTRTEIAYSFDSTAANFTIDFYYSTAADSSGYGEGEVYFCTDIIAHPGGGSANYSESCATEVPPSTYITAVATRGTGPGYANYFSSSEFSQALQVVWLATDGSVNVSASTAVAAHISIQVDDIDLDVNPGVAETVAVTLNNDTTAEMETVTLTETGVNTGVFTAQVPTTYSLVAGTNEDGVLSGASGHNYSVDYTDEYDATGATVIRSDSGVFTNGLVIAVDDSASVQSGKTVTIQVLANDIDPEGALDTASLQVTADPSHGSTLVNPLAGTIIFSAFSSYVGVDAFTYNVCDTAAACDTGVVNITTTQGPVIAAATPTPSVNPTLAPQITVSPTTNSKPSPTPTLLQLLPETGGENETSSIDIAFGKLLFSLTVLAPALVLVAISAFAYPGVTIYAFSWFKRLPRVAPWGIIYDRTTMNPVAFASVQLLQGDRLIEERVTDLEGKYGFVNDKGMYSIVVKHADYEATQAQFDLGRKEGIVARDIALDPVVAKANAAVPWKLRLRSAFYKISLALFLIGLTLAIVAVTVSPNTYNIIVQITYALQLVLAGLIKIRLNSKRSWGYVYSTADEKRVKGAFVRVLDKAELRQLEVQMTDEAGRFGFILKPDQYLLAASAIDYQIPSSKIPHKFTTGPTGEQYTEVKVDKSQAIDLVIAADPQFSTIAPPSNLPSPFA